MNDAGLYYVDGVQVTRRTAMTTIAAWAEAQVVDFDGHVDVMLGELALDGYTDCNGVAVELVPDVHGDLGSRHEHVRADWVLGTVGTGRVQA